MSQGVMEKYHGAMHLLYDGLLLLLLSAHVEAGTTTLEVSLSMDGIRFFLEHETVENSRLQELRYVIDNIDDKINRIDEGIADIRQLIKRQFSASAAIDMENRMRNILDIYNIVLKAVQDLHANKSAYSSTEFRETAVGIRRHLKMVMDKAKEHLPSDLPSLSRVLLGDTVSGAGSTDGLLCDVVSSSLRKLSESDLASYNLTATIQNGPALFLSSMTSLQTLSIALLNMTCSSNDLVCHRQVSQLLEGLQRQSARMDSCLPPALTRLAREGRLTGRLLEAGDDGALTRQDVYDPDSDRTWFLPFVVPRTATPRQVVVLESAGRFFRIVLGHTCHLSLHHREDVSCSARTTEQDALFMVVGDRQGSLGLVNTQTGRHMVAGKGGNCLGKVIELEERAGFPWTFEDYDPKYVDDTSQDDAYLAKRCTGNLASRSGRNPWTLVSLLVLAASVTSINC